MGFPREEYWSGLPVPSLGDLPDPGIKPKCPTLQKDSLPSEPPGKSPIIQHQAQKPPPYKAFLDSPRELIFSTLFGIN